MLRFRLLGAFEAHHGDERIPASAWRTRHARAVLEILLDRRGRPVPFDRLTDAIWPEADPGAARNSLQVAVRTIRRVLEPELRGGGASRYVRTEGEAYRFVPDECWIDVNEFSHERDRALAAERSGDLDRAIASARAALSLYRGDHLADDPQAEWALATRERLREAMLDLAERLARWLAAEGTSDEAVAVAERGLSADPLREALYQAAMRAHLAAGRRSHALAAYERCRSLLRAELGIEPGQVTQRLRAEIATMGTAQPAGARERPTPRPAVDVPFVGRLAELAALRSVWDRAGHEPGHIALLDGATGVGKTRLARELADALGPQARIVWMTAHEAEHGLSFAPILAFLAGRLDRGASVGQLQRLGPHAPVLAHVLPEVRALWPDCPPLEVRPPEPTHVLEALTRAVAMLGAGGRALVVLDDAHWADDSTLLWIGYAARRLPAGTMILLTRRTGERETHALDAEMGERRKVERLLSLALGPLSSAEMTQVVAAVSDDPASAAEVAARIHAATEGSPLFAIEILRELRRRGDLSVAGAGELPIPPSVRETIALRAERLDAAGRDALCALAVLGVPSPATILATATGQGDEAILASLELLLDRELARPSADGRTYTVEHPLVGRVVYETLTAPRRAAWHRRAATALQRHAPELASGAAGQILRHLVAAGAASEEIASAAEAVADEALRRDAYADAIAALELAHAHLPARSSEPATVRRRARATERLGDALHGAGRWDEAIARYRELLGGADAPLMRSRLRRRIAQVMGDVGGRFAEALTVLDDAERDLVGARGEAVDERGRIEAARTVALFYRGQYHDAIDRGSRALDLWRGREGLERETMEQLSRMALSEQRLGRLDDAEPRLREALAMARRLGDRLAEARYLENLSGVVFQRGTVGTSLELEERAQRIYAEVGAPKFEMIGLVNLGNKLTTLGDLRRAKRAYEDAIERSEALAARYTTMHALVGMGETLVRMGSAASAKSALERGIAMAEEIGNRQRLAHAHLYLAELALAEGSAERARREIEQGSAIGEPIDDSHTVREGCPVLARALLAVDDAAGAEVAARRGLARADEGGFGVAIGRNRVALAEALWRRGDAAAADRELEQAIAIFRGAPARYDLAHALLVRATTLLKAQRRPWAEALDEALVLARGCGARLLARRISAAVTAPVA